MSFRVRYASVVLLVWLPLVGCQQSKKEDAAQPKVGPVEEVLPAVSISTVEKKDLVISIALTGTLKAQMEVDISSKTPGRLSSVKVDMGQEVKKGDTLATLENRDTAMSIKQAQAQLASAQAQKDQANLDVDRMRKLQEGGASTDSEFTSIKTKQTLANSSYDAANAMLSLAKENLNNSVLKAPFPGVITKRTANPGQTVSPGTLLFTLHDLSAMILEAGVAERDLGRVQVGQLVNMKVEAYPGQNFEGKIKIIGKSLDPATRKIPLQVEFPNADKKLLSQMYAKAKLQLDTREGALLIPEAALMEPKGSATSEIGEAKDVFVVKEGVAFRKRVGIGAIVDGSCEVLTGLGQGEIVITSGQSLVKDNNKVKVIQ
jgi:membrane fusion protein, multidrug efflux system